jgi:hypothetical protein
MKIIAKMKFKRKKANINGIKSFKLYVNIFTKNRYSSLSLMYWSILTKIPIEIRIITIISIIYKDPGKSKLKQKYKIK